uniref:Uncharacterized protein n=1 Tax=Beta macrocarpa TaxID=343494 RepID=G2XLX8_BETMA|nr:hypothetical protein LKY79_mgp042 [Beta macrocarpa]CBX24968.1 hypothetical protein [Beta macrocarpa]
MRQLAQFFRNFIISLLIFFSECFFRSGDSFFLSNKNFLFFILVFLLLSFLFKLYSHYFNQLFSFILNIGLFIVAVMILSYVRAHWHTYFGVCFVGVYSLFGMGAPSTGGTGGMSCTYMMPSGSDASNGNGEWRGYLNDSPEGGDAVSDAENVPAAENPPGHPNEAAPAAPQLTLDPPVQRADDQAYLRDLLLDPELDQDYKRALVLEERITLKIKDLYPEGQYPLQDIRKEVDVALTDIMALEPLPRDQELVRIWESIGREGRYSDIVAEVEAGLGDPS